MKEEIYFKILSAKNIAEIALLGQQLNSKLTIQEVEQYIEEMFTFSTYNCFGLYQKEKLIGISSGWITIRLYSGKQLEIDNVIIDGSLQSKGLGKIFLSYIEDWATKNDCKTIELNTYVQNSKSHKFYFNSGFSILGFHFWKHI
jgi:GNAT superfamily N-acetyltransferase